ncbi:glycoside hydrolase family 36 protein [Streptomyces sp. NPDC048506]|uniref:glycoside hydrolase family 36 protein n=1 Tax=Streptomyces sp. NPDC048506 TaxID=3155028 RepID=UPI003434D229
MTHTTIDERHPVATCSTASEALSTFAPDLWSDRGPQTTCAHGTVVTALAPQGAVRLLLADEPLGTCAAVTAEHDAVVTVRLDVPLGDAVGYWHPNAGSDRTLPADWSVWRNVSLVESAPVGCLYDTAGRALLAFATDRTVALTAVRFGVSEEHKRFGVWLRLPLAAGGTYRIRLLPPGDTVAGTLRVLRRWFAALPGGEPMSTPEFGRTPVYSTWYSFTQDVSAGEVEREAALAAELGFGQLFLDDGWQRHGSGRGYSGCGDWRPDTAKFPDFRAHVDTVHALGLRHVLWIAPLLLGERADVFPWLSRFATHWSPTLDCWILDPRHLEVRDYVVRTCLQLVDEFGLDGLKADFLDEAMVYAGASRAQDSTRDGYLPDVGASMAAMLTDLREGLRHRRGDDFVIELRQRYTGPAMTAFGNLLRANDCPADAVANRIRTLDIALLAPGGTVHSDMLMWDPQAAPDVVAHQFHGALHAVPQTSARLSQLPTAHRDALAFWLTTWRALRPALLSGHYEPGRPDQLYPQVVATDDDRCVITCFVDRIVALRPDLRQVSLINATSADQLFLSLDAPWTVHLTPHDAQGRAHTPVIRELTPGLNAVAVPPGGLCHVRETGTVP